MVSRLLARARQPLTVEPPVGGMHRGVGADVTHDRVPAGLHHPLSKAVGNLRTGVDDGSSRRAQISRGNGIGIVLIDGNHQTPGAHTVSDSAERPADIHIGTTVLGYGKSIAAASLHAHRPPRVLTHRRRRS